MKFLSVQFDKINSACRVTALRKYCNHYDFSDLIRPQIAKFSENEDTSISRDFFIEYRRYLNKEKIF